MGSPAATNSPCRCWRERTVPVTGDRRVPSFSNRWTFSRRAGADAGGELLALVLERLEIRGRSEAIGREPGQPLLLARRLGELGLKLRHLLHPRPLLSRDLITLALEVRG